MSSDNEASKSAASKSKWSLPARREEFRKRLEQISTPQLYRLADFQGKPLDRTILSVPIDLPRYRISNGRTMSAQQEYIAKSENLKEDYFSNGDPELKSLQDAQHNILKPMIKAEGLRAKFRDTKETQIEPIILDENGFIVNGNRRLCCWRELLKEDSEEYSHFREVDVVVLPRCDEDEISRLEAKLQIEKDIRSDYSWHAEAYMYDLKMKQPDMSARKVAKFYKTKESNVRNLIAKRELAAEYLKLRNRENMWSDVDKFNFAFEGVRKSIRACEHPVEGDILKHAAFIVIEERKEADQRLYSLVQQIQKHLDEVGKELCEKFPQMLESDDVDNENPFGGEAEEEGSELARRLKLINKLRSSEIDRARACNVITHTVDTQEFLSKEKNKADILLTLLARALSNVSDATAHGLKAESSKGGVREQVEQIRSELDKIESWLGEDSEC